MKNKLMYLIAVLFAASVCFSCSDDDNNEDRTDLLGKWNYTKEAKDIHFELEYNTGMITFPEGMIPAGTIPEGIPGVTEAGISVEMLKLGLPMIANKYMSLYFRGINFTSETEMEILMTMDEQPVSLKTTYTTQKNIVKISTQSDGFKQLMGEIPVQSIDLNYSINKDKLTLYLNTAYVKAVLSVVPTILKDVDLPVEQKTKIGEFIQDFSTNLKTLEFGATLSR